jgi:DNA polymerase-3 subunit alpha
MVPLLDDFVEYVTDKYGEKNVGQIITYGKLKAKGTIRDVGRTLNFTYGETDKIANLIPDQPGISLEEALAQEPKLREMRENDERVDALFDIALSIENLNRQAGIHAAGDCTGGYQFTHYAGFQGFMAVRNALLPGTIRSVLDRVP